MCLLSSTPLFEIIHIEIFKIKFTSFFLFPVLLIVNPFRFTSPFLNGNIFTEVFFFVFIKNNRTVTNWIYSCIYRYSDFYNLKPLYSILLCSRNNRLHFLFYFQPFAVLRDARSYPGISAAFVLSLARSAYSASWPTSPDSISTSHGHSIFKMR